MTKPFSTDYQTFREIMDELLRPIDGNGLDADTMKRLYESKLVYLENLRLKCFSDINRGRPGQFSVADYQLILTAIRETNLHLRHLILHHVSVTLSQRRTG